MNWCSIKCVWSRSDGPIRISATIIRIGINVIIRFQTSLRFVGRKCSKRSILILRRIFEKEKDCSQLIGCSPLFDETKLIFFYFDAIEYRKMLHNKREGLRCAATACRRPDEEYDMDVGKKVRKTAGP